MQVVPTRSAFHLTLLGAACTLTGIGLSRPVAVLWGGALLLGVVLARAAAKWGAARSRASGFEMVWDDRRRLIPAVRGAPLKVFAILTNRDSRPLEFSELALMHAAGMEARVTPRSGIIPRGASVRVRVELTSYCAGPCGVFGLSIKTSRPPGLFVVPLLFSNPLVILTAPESHVLGARAIKGNRCQAQPRRTVLSREIAEFRELREHRPGDPFRRIAWKPSARRGKLLVVETEEKFDADVWVLLDASLELSRGTPGKTPKESALEHAASLIRARLEAGQRVGLIVYAGRELVRIHPEPGRRQWLRMRLALTEEVHTADADRSALSIFELEQLALEHISALDPRLADGGRQPVSTEQLEALTRGAPYEPQPIFAASPHERALRTYLRAFGIDSPPLDTDERPRSERRLAAILGERTFKSGRAGEVIVVGPPPDAHSPKELLSALERVVTRGTSVWFHAVGSSMEVSEAEPERSEVFRRVKRARLEAGLIESRKILRARGVKVLAVSHQRPRE